MKPIVTDTAPRAIGPYSQAIRVDNWLYCSGQIPLHPETGDLIGEGDIVAQTGRVLENLQAVLGAAGGNPKCVVKTTVFLKDMDQFDDMDRVYGDFFGEARPARATVEVSRLPKDVLVEIDCVAYLG